MNARVDFSACVHASKRREASGDASSRSWACDTLATSQESVDGLANCAQPEGRRRRKSEQL